MYIFELTPQNAHLVAELMARLVPEWWDYDSAMKQITASGKVGWYMGEDADTPKGWIVIKGIEDYSCVEIDASGYDDNGEFTSCEKLAALLDKVEQYAIAKGLRLVRETLSSPRMSCHGRKVTDYVKELSTLKSTSKKLEYMQSRGYRLAGFMPDCYEVGVHGIMILKNLCEV